jgi:hypothetical protein
MNVWDYYNKFFHRYKCKNCGTKHHLLETDPKTKKLVRDE